MYIDGPWGRGTHNEDLNMKTVRIPAGPQGKQGTLLITDSIAVFNNTGNEEMANKFAAMVTSPEWQYKLDTEWGINSNYAI